MANGPLDGKRVVVALGGNALGTTPQEQLKLLDGAAAHLTRMVKEGINVVITHGNGPQVGIIDEAFAAASKNPANQVPFMPLADCNAMSQGYIGAQLTCALMNQFRAQDVMRNVADVPTHVVVDADDPAFKDLEKPIGAFMSEQEAKAFAKATGCQVRETRAAAGGAWWQAPCRRTSWSWTPSGTWWTTVVWQWLRAGAACRWSWRTARIGRWTPSSTRTW